jgi:uncharacterized protein DUF4259
MGAWGFLPFENDDALDWLDELDAGGAEAVRGALANAGADYLEAPDGSVAIAAAEVTSACQGNPPGDLPEDAASWVTAHGAEIGPEDVELALQAVTRVAGEESELAELWDDADEPEWRESLGELSERLRAALR